MGIQGLLPLLRSIHKQSHLRKFAGQVIGIDAYGWLHRGSVACAIELALGKPTTKYVDFAVNRVRMLLDHGITPYLVFDGDALPSKAGTNAERRRRREESKARGLELYKAKQVSQAYQELQKATAVTQSMAKELIDELKRMNVQYIVAPYEADPQLVYLEEKGIINGILSEDSDMLVYGAKLLLTKLNQYGDCVEIDRADFAMCKDISLAGWTDTMFRRMAILSGCDYLPSIDKMGLKTAYRYIRKYREIEKTIQMVQFEGKMLVSADYLSRFREAELTFIHHRVFCPIARQIVFKNELLPGMKEEHMPYLGPYVEPETAIGVACGDLDPKTKEPFMLNQASRPSLQENGGQLGGAGPTLKHNKSIDSFFKPRRQPLAELDPNSLTPSPSQQALLDRHRNASWEPRLVSSAPQLRRTTSALATSSPSMDRNVFLARASQKSTYQASKRPRLCSETQDPSPAREIKQSPYFAAGAGQPSPLVQKKARNKKARVAAFDVWSDDSVDDVLLNLPEVQQAATPSKPFLESQATPEADPTSSDDGDCVPESSPIKTQPPKTTSHLPKAPDVEMDQELEPFEDLLETYARLAEKKVAEAGLRKTFAYQSSSKREAALRSLSAETSKSGAVGTTPKQTTLNTSIDLSPLKQQACFRSSARTFVMQSPERQMAALTSLRKPGSISKVCDNVKAHGESTVTRSVRHTQQVSETTLSAPSVEKHSSGQRSKQSMSAQVSGQNTTAVQYPALRHMGSEDALIPNSEDEGSEVEVGEHLPTLDLRAFAYKAR